MVEISHDDEYIILMANIIVILVVYKREYHIAGKIYIGANSTLIMTYRSHRAR